MMDVITITFGDVIDEMVSTKLKLGTSINLNLTKPFITQLPYYTIACNEFAVPISAS